MKRIGIDVGGTNTYAVLISGYDVLASVKAPTSENVTGGILAALSALRREVDVGDDVEAVLIGTTHFINAVVQRRSLAKVGAIRIAAPATTELPPLCDWPTDLGRIIDGGSWIVEGGFDYDGRRFMPLDRAAIRKACRDIRNNGLAHVAITGMFSPLNAEDEQIAAGIVLEECPHASITCSHELGGIGLLERENAAILNACLVHFAQETIEAFGRAVASAGIDAPLFITQNDGTAVTADQAAARPVYSFVSGPTNSMRGAAFLSGLDDAIVIDVGGTTSDFGNLISGFPRTANDVVHVGGVRTLFRMPDLVSIGLGGGSVINPDTCAIGPTSVGFRLVEKALVFGGNTLTASDIAVAARLANMGERAKVAHLPARLVDGVLARARTTIEDYVDRTTTQAGDVTLLAVGGGSFFVPEKLAGVSRVVRVEHGDCANAIGAAIAQIAGEVDQVFQGLTRPEAIAQARELAEQRAITAGADAKTLSLVEAEDIPIAYLPGNALRVKVKVVGEIANLQRGVRTDAGQVPSVYA